jgi:uncharacterized membrane protein YheB (UPF0754 family)
MDVMPFIVFPPVGALIGALTNQIAIKMLFRPYRAWTIGPWRVPLTPGVIPQQRHIIAQNMAETFEANLLSGQEIHSLITGDKVQIALEVKVDEFLQGLGPLAMMAAPMKGDIIKKILEGIEEVASDAIEQGGDLHIAEKIEAKINAMDIEKLEELVLGFSQKQFRYITLFGGILGALIGLAQAGLSTFL